METKKLGRNRGFRTFTTMPGIKWDEIKNDSIKIENLKLGDEYQIVSGSKAANLRNGKSVHIRRLEQMHLVECSLEKLVFESREFEKSSGKITYFPGMFDKIAIFSADSDISHRISEFDVCAPA